MLTPKSILRSLACTAHTHGIAARLSVVFRSVPILFDELRVHRDLLFDERAHFLGRVPYRVEALAVEALFHVRHPEDPDELVRTRVSMSSPHSSRGTPRELDAEDFASLYERYAVDRYTLNDRGYIAVHAAAHARRR